MADTFKGATGPKQADEAGFHAEVLSDGESGVLSILNLKTQVWSMAIIETPLTSNGACLAYAMRAALNPAAQGAVTEEENEDYFDRCLDLEEKLKETAGFQGVDVDDEEEDQDNDFL
jgi:hypothetical protein